MYRATFFAYDQSSFGPKFVFWKEINDAHVGVLQTKKFPSRVRAALTNCFVHSASAVLMAVQHTVLKL